MKLRLHWNRGLLSTMVAIILIALALPGTSYSNAEYASGSRVSTPVGSAIEVSLGPDVTIVLDSVDVAGETSMTSFPFGPPLPNVWTHFHASPTFYSIQTSASYVGQISIEVALGEGASETLEPSLVYFQNGSWNDIMDSVSQDNDMIFGRSGSLSTFIVGAGVMCGDASDDSSVDIDDVVYLLSFVFAGGPAPPVESSGDANCSDAIDIDDITYLIEYIFSNGPAPCESCSEVDRIVIMDQTGVEWDITHAVHQYGFDQARFSAGIGGFVFTPIIEPDFIGPGDEGYPDLSQNPTIIGTQIESEIRAYKIIDFRFAETCNDVYDSAHVLVAY